MAKVTHAEKQPQREAGSPPVDPCAPCLHSAETESQLPLRLIPIETVCGIIGLKRSATLRMVQTGELPQPIKFGASRRAAARWIESEIVDYVMSKAAERKVVAIESRRKGGSK